MSTITKEWLQQTIAEYEANRDELPFGLDTNSSIELQAFKLALASLEAEKNAVPVAKVETVGVCWYADNGVPRKPAVGTELYTAAPAPVSVPDEDLLHMAASAIEDLLSNKDRYCAGVWVDIPAKLRRAAMLQRGKS
ncbi:TPA: hypothetical protein N5O09_000424 [Enterobacter roggenkampii]|nr:hypothetical protein [Enterobacter roggenkampii]